MLRGLLIIFVFPEDYRMLFVSMAWECQLGGLQPYQTRSGHITLRHRLNPALHFLPKSAVLCHEIFIKGNCCLSQMVRLLSPCQGQPAGEVPLLSIASLWNWWVFLAFSTNRQPWDGGSFIPMDSYFPGIRWACKQITKAEAVQQWAIVVSEQIDALGHFQKHTIKSH